MENEQLEKLRYPIGKYEVPELITDDQLKKWIHILEQLPARLENMVSNLSEEQAISSYVNHKIVKAPLETTFPSLT